MLFKCCLVTFPGQQAASVRSTDLRSKGGQVHTEKYNREVTLCLIKLYIVKCFMLTYFFLMAYYILRPAQRRENGYFQESLKYFPYAWFQVSDKVTVFNCNSESKLLKSAKSQKILMPGRGRFLCTEHHHVATRKILEIT